MKRENTNLNLFDHLYGTGSIKEIKELFVEDLKAKDVNIMDIYNKYIPFLWEQDKSLYTIRDRYQDIKTMISAVRMNRVKKNEILKMLTLNEKMFSYLNQKSNADLKEDINNKKIFDKESYLAKLEHFKTHINEKCVNVKRNPMQKQDYILAQFSAIYLVLNTGRRTFEIFKTLEIIKNGKTTFFKGLSKKREEEKKEAKYKAYLLDDDFKTTKKALQYVRDYYKETLADIDYGKFNQNYTNNINKFLKKQFEDFDFSVTYKLIRDMYTDFAIDKFMPEGYDLENFRNEVLGHEAETEVGLAGSYRKTESVSKSNMTKEDRIKHLKGLPNNLGIKYAEIKEFDTILGQIERVIKTDIKKVNHNELDKIFARLEEMKIKAKNYDAKNRFIVYGYTKDKKEKIIIVKALKQSDINIKDLGLISTGNYKPKIEKAKSNLWKIHEYSFIK